MKYLFRAALTLVACAFYSQIVCSQKTINTDVVNISKGWSQTSVNATIFRKNSVTSHNGNQYVAFYDSTAHVVLAKRHLNSETWEIRKTQFIGNIKDAHNIISIMVDGNGYVHMAWDHHNNQLHYSISLKPESLIMGDERAMVGKNEKIVSYPEFYKQDNGNLFFAYRDGGSGNGNLVLNYYNTNLKEWSRVHDNLIDGEGKRNAYWQLFVKGNDIHISWVWRESPNVASNHDMCYAKSTDSGKTWVNSKSQPYTIPINIASAQTVWQIPQNSNLINQTSMTVDDKGMPYIATYYKGKDDDCTQYYIIYQKGNRWIQSKATNRTLDFNLSGGGSRSIPISRPQIVYKNSFLSTPKLYIIYRDEENQNHIMVSKGIFKNGEICWNAYPISNHSVDRWEPSYDTELWRSKQKFHLYSQKVGQGQGETSVIMPSQMVQILEVDL